MASLLVSGIARITRDPDVRKASSGAWCYFGIAAYRKNVKDGKQTADFFDAEMFVKEGSGNDRKLRKGNLIYIENGFLRNDQFKGQDGQDKNKMKILVTSFEVLKEDAAPAAPKEEDVKKTSTHPSDLPPPVDLPREAKKEPKKEPVEEIKVEYDNPDDEEIPF